MHCAPGPRTPSSIAIPYHFGSGPSGTSLGSSVPTQVGVPCSFPGWRGVLLRVLCAARSSSPESSRFSPQSIDFGAKKGKNGISKCCHIECADSAHSNGSYFELLCFCSKSQKEKFISSLMISGFSEICMWNCI